MRKRCKRYNTNLIEIVCNSKSTARHVSLKRYLRQERCVGYKELQMGWNDSKNIKRHIHHTLDGHDGDEIIDIYYDINSVNGYDHWVKNCLLYQPLSLSWKILLQNFANWKNCFWFLTKIMIKELVILSFYKSFPSQFYIK